jgi:hypothetical protein
MVNMSLCSSVANHRMSEIYFEKVALFFSYTVPPLQELS